MRLKDLYSFRVARDVIENALRALNEELKRRVQDTDTPTDPHTENRASMFAVSRILMKRYSIAE